MPKKPELSEEDEALRKDFGASVRAARESLRLKPAEFAAVGGVSMAHQYRIEAGERTADVLYVQRLVQRYGPTIVELLLGTVERSAAPVHKVTVTAHGGHAAGRDLTINHSKDEETHAKQSKRGKPPRQRSGA